jgi:hypothetical protein
MDFIAAFYAMHNNSFTAVGINRGSLEWHQHVIYLLENSDLGFDGDYTEFDGTLFAQIVREIAFIVNYFYTYGFTKEDPYVEIRKTLMFSQSQAMHLFAKWVYISLGGTCTGSTMTVITNTLDNEMNLRMAWLNLVPAPYNTMFHYRNNVRTRIYGDDNVVSVKPMFLPHFNAVKVGEFLAPFGIKYGPADKGGEMIPFKSILETSFLKNDIGRQFGFYVAQLDKKVIFETINWIRRCSTPEQACNDNCNCSLRDAFFHGEEFFNKLRCDILKLRPAYNLLTYGELVNEFLEYGQVIPWSNDFGFTRHPPTYDPKLLIKLRCLEDPTPITAPQIVAPVKPLNF